MNDPAYSGIRQEMTQTFYAFRQIITAEYAAYPFLLVALLQSTATITTVLFDILLAALVVIVTLLGRSWFLQATRQGSYILVTFELPAVAANPTADRAGSWILANRSFANFLTKKHRDTFHFPSRELHHFLVQQMALGIVAAIVVVLLMAFNPFLYFATPHFASRAALSAAMILPPASAIVYVAIQLARSGTINRDITRAWLEYADARETADFEYLQELGLDAVYLQRFKPTPKLTPEAASAAPA